MYQVSPSHIAIGIRGLHQTTGAQSLSYLATCTYCSMMPSSMFSLSFCRACFGAAGIYAFFLLLSGSFVLINIWRAKIKQK